MNATILVISWFLVGTITMYNILKKKKEYNLFNVIEWGWLCMFVWPIVLLDLFGDWAYEKRLKINKDDK